MDQIRLAMANIQQQVGKMGASQKLLLASLVVIATMTLFLVSQYAAKPATVALMAADGQVDTVQALQSGGFDAQMVDGQVVVPTSQQRYALSYLAESGQLPGDTTLLFSNLIGSQDWKASSAQHRQQFYIALQNELSRRITDFSSINKASVILDVPMSSGLGRASRSPTASITLFSSSGGAVSQNVVDAAARTVSGAVSGLSPAAVQVVDGLTGQARTTSNEDSQSSSQYLERQTQVEKHTKQKIEGLFAHIPGVVVSVTARVDITKVQSTENYYLPKSEGTVAELVLSEQTGDKSVTQASQGAESGVRSNQTASINTGAGSAGPSNTDNTVDRVYENAIGQRTTNTADARGMATRLSASIIIPQEYIESIIERSRPVVEGEEPTPVTMVEAEEFFATRKIDIENLIKPHLESIDGKGQVVEGALVVSMASTGVSMTSGGAMQSVGFMGSLTSSGGVLGSPGKMIENALVLVLAVVSLGMMAMMVKRSSKKIELPSANELVGVPPHLETIDDLIGEASEGDHIMTGIEIDDQLIEVQQIREQVSEMIKQDPETAAGLVERWAEHVE